MNVTERKEESRKSTGYRRPALMEIGRHPKDMREGRLT